MKKFNSTIARVRNSAGEFEALPALRGLDSYQLAVQNGFNGTEEEWMNSIIGDGWVGAFQQLETEQTNIKNKQTSIEEEQQSIVAKQNAIELEQAAIERQVEAITPEYIGAAELNDKGKVKASQTSSLITTVSSSMTLDSTYSGKFIWAASGDEIVITLPKNDNSVIAPGAEFEFCKGSDGNVVFTAETDVLLFSVDGAKTITSKYGVVCLKKINTDIWLLAGALE